MRFSCGLSDEMEKEMLEGYGDDGRGNSIITCAYMEMFALYSETYTMVKESILQIELSKSEL